MRIIPVILLPILFAAVASLYAGSELYFQKSLLSEHTCSAEKDAGQTVSWKNHRFDRRALWLAAGLILLPGVGLYLLGAFYYHNLPIYNLKLLFCYALAVDAACIDSVCRKIPNHLILAGLFGGLCFQLAECLLGYTVLKTSVLESFLGILVGGGVFLLCSLVTHGGIGMGDVKLFSVLGLMLGWTGVFDLIFITVLLMVLYGVILIVRKRLTIRSEVPIGPFALVGMALMMLLGV